MNCLSGLNSELKFRKFETKAKSGIAGKGLTAD
jgi:hypothetical protein